MKNFRTILIASLIISFSVFFSACSVMNTNYSFYHHGTESIKTNSDFKYVNFGVIGKAKTTYYPNKLRKQQEIVKDGLIADAKKNLHEKAALKNNQAYANLTIDILETTKGSSSQYGTVIQEVTIEAVVSADIIEYID